MISTTLVGAVAFNLSCSIVSFGFMGAMPTIPSTPMAAAVYRVDLVSRRFCQGDCRTTEPIAKITATQLFLKLTDEPRLMEYLSINRESGDMLSMWSVGRSPASVETGTCAATEFTGFPARKF
jgi:hypothetical protein